MEMFVGRVGARQSLITRIGILPFPGDLLEAVDPVQGSQFVYSPRCLVEIVQTKGGVLAQSN